MGLLSSYSDYNKVTDTALMVRYAVEPDVIDTWSWVDGPVISGGGASPVVRPAYIKYNKPYYIVHRYATKSYKYVGMDYSTAISCQTDKLNQYTRPFTKVIELLSSTGGDPEHDGKANVLSTATTYECRSDIACQHVDGGMWEVIINVNEDDEKFSYQLPADPASMFDEANQRDYDN